MTCGSTVTASAISLRSSARNIRRSGELANLLSTNGLAGNPQMRKTGHPTPASTSISGNSRRLTKTPVVNPILAPYRRRWWRICCGSLRNPATSLSIRLPVPVPLWTWRRRWGGVSGRRTFAAITIRLICRSTSMILPLVGLMLHPERPISYSLIRPIGSRHPVAIQQNLTNWRNGRACIR